MESSSTPLRIAMLTHSVNPRGGVVHALQLAEGLQALGHEVSLFAPDARGKGLFRPAACTFHPVPGPVQSGKRYTEPTSSPPTTFLRNCKGASQLKNLKAALATTYPKMLPS